MRIERFKVYAGYDPLSPSNTRHSKEPSTLDPEPYTLHPKPYTLHQAEGLSQQSELQSPIPTP